MGYPVHISLLDKNFAEAKKLNVIYLADSPSSLYRYTLGESNWHEYAVRGGDKSATDFTGTGPIDASTSVPVQYQTALDFARSRLQSIVNLPSSQKAMANYDVGLVETRDMIWVEFGPHYGAGEEPHLGCQTQVGRDMVFGFLKSDLAQGKNAPRFLQCF